jgi:hypothetical protein
VAGPSRTAAAENIAEPGRVGGHLGPGQSASAVANGAEASTSLAPDMAGNGELHQMAAMPLDYGIEHQMAAPTSAASAAGGQMAEASRDRVPLRDLLEEKGIALQSYAPGQYNNLHCPQCLGGSSKERSFSINISPDSQDAAWKCHRGGCGFTGAVSTAHDRNRGRTGLEVSLQFAQPYWLHLAIFFLLFALLATLVTPMHDRSSLLVLLQNFTLSDFWSGARHEHVVAFWGAEPAWSLCRGQQSSREAGRAARKAAAQPAAPN